jgi:hypothetical protein
MSAFHRRLPLTFLALVSVGGTLAWGQSGPPGTESSALVTSAGYLSQWPPGPPAGSVPDWARPGRIRFSRWDGGPIETSKAMLSGWPGFNPPIPDYLYVMTNWYQPSTIGLLRRANINLIWVTFSNGFSIPSEKRQREMLRDYIDQCHRQGIRVMAYQSVANMFWEDMYEHVPESRNWVSIGKDGKPVPYGAADASKMGRVTRYMADLAHPQWRDYLRQRIDLAIDAGADGIMYDNAFSAHLSETFMDIMRHALGRKKDFLIMANFHRAHFILNRLLNAITTEEGGEAGIFSEENMTGERGRGSLERRSMPTRWNNERKTMLPIEGGFLANNIGRFRIFENLSEGYKPVMIESRVREQGAPETHVMTAARHQLVLAENMMFNVATEVFVEGRFAYGLWYGEPEILKIWDAIGQYNRFFAENNEYYVGAKSLASLAIVLDNRSEGEAVLNGLAGRNVLYHVLYEHELTPQRLKPYAAVLLLTADLVRDEALAALQQYVESGGKAFAAPQSAAHDEKGRPRARPAWLGKKLCRCDSESWDHLPPMDDLAAILRKADRPAPVRIEAPSGVLYNITHQTAQRRLIVHLTNYLPRPAGPVVVAVEGRYKQAALLTPDTPRDLPHTVRVAENHTKIVIPRVKTYTVVVLSEG